MPGDVGLIGFDGIKAGEHASPALSSVEPDFRQAGVTLVDKLLQVAAGISSDSQRVPVHLLARASSAGPRPRRDGPG